MEDALRHLAIVLFIQARPTRSEAIVLRHDLDDGAICCMVLFGRYVRVCMSAAIAATAACWADALSGSSAACHRPAHKPRSADVCASAGQGHSELNSDVVRCSKAASSLVTWRCSAFTCMTETSQAHRCIAMREYDATYLDVTEHASREAKCFGLAEHRDAQRHFQVGASDTTSTQTCTPEQTG